MIKGLEDLDLKSLAIFAIPLLLLLSDKKGMSLNLKFDKNFESKSELIENIKPYFSFQEQDTLNKVQDIIEIFNKVNKIQNSNYSKTSTALTQGISSGDRKEKILAEMSKHLEGKGKEIADNLISTRQRLLETSSKLDRHKKGVKGQGVSKTDEMLSLVNCLKPIMPDQGKRRMKKIETILDLMKKPDSEF
ncbi:hypothetical protein [Sporosalibacterium faouarense]|uniref:hypothetical protein n=1 Tax=Sporosalibacterium faouarense TaxID=516123 RepID=UPI00141C2782|nr:hypothetical protein [Sporosalibacterium faouarense]MTI49617.1 hypothetical protein [Bacillota bacterium]